MERAIYGWEDEGGVPTLGIVVSLSEAKLATEALRVQVDLIHTIGNRIVWALAGLGVLGIVNALHLYGVSDAITSFVKGH